MKKNIVEKEINRVADRIVNTQGNEKISGVLSILNDDLETAGTTLKAIEEKYGEIENCNIMIEEKESILVIRMKNVIADSCEIEINGYSGIVMMGSVLVRIR